MKNVSLDIPRGKLVVITGLSGSGKSSLAFDTIYAEGQRRYVESLSAYARQFLGLQDKPDVDKIEGLSPAVAINQKSIAKNPRSTVGTITEVHDYLRLLFSRVGKPHCPGCGRPVTRQSVSQITDQVMALPKGTEILILAPLIRNQKGEHKGVLEEVLRAGFVRVRFDGIVYRLDEIMEKPVDRQKKHDIEVVIDRLDINGETERSRVADDIEVALKVGKGLVIVQKIKGAMLTAKVAETETLGRRKKEIGGAGAGRIRGEAASRRTEEILFSEMFACVKCGINLPEIEPRMFSFNSPEGACPGCTGLGSKIEVDPEAVIPNKNLTLAEGAIRPWMTASHRVGRQSWYYSLLIDLAERHHFSLDEPVSGLPPKIVNLILYGDPSTGSGREKFEGVIPNLERRWKETDSEFTRREIERYMLIRECPTCRGRRLKPESLAVKISGRDIAEIAGMPVGEALRFFDNISSGKSPARGGLSAHDLKIAAPIFKEISRRLKFLIEVGLDYLTLARESTTLAGGEIQRIRLATQIGSGLCGVVYILDEPSVGLHSRDQARLIKTLKELRDLGNSVIVVEHDQQTIMEADWAVDIGPGAGERGGEVIFEGTPGELLKAKTLTGDYLAGRKKVEVHGSQISKSQIPNSLIIKGAEEHNLKNIDVSIPLGKFVCFSGVSGSGKSTLLNDILARHLLKHFYRARVQPGKHKKILGLENLDKVVIVDQSPIGRTPRSNPATYTGAFGHIRELLAKTNLARMRGYGAGRFSFNVKGGRCETCEGQGLKKIEMYFLPDVYVKCEECGGTRYNKEALEIEYDGKNIAQILEMSAEEAMNFFKNIPPLKEKLKTMFDVGLGYLKLGQPAPTLSGGEAQRIKLAAELSRKQTGRTLYILDEPTTGLHFDDIKKLLQVLRGLVDKGNSVLVIEHNLDVLRNADWIVDLGPEGGNKGGEVVAEGTPQDIVKAKRSYTGQYLKKIKN